MDIERWDTYDIAFDAEGSFANPFQDVELSVTFTHGPSGKSVTAKGFFDGGPVWRVRFMPDELGRWCYTTRSNARDLNGRTGSLICIPPTKPYLHGPLSTEGLHFRHADGTRRFLISTRFTCQFAPPTVWPRVIRFLQEHRINRVLFIMGGRAGTMKDLYGDGPDFWRYNVSRFQAIDAFIDALRQADILVSPYFYYFNDGAQRAMMPDQDRAYIRYGMARFGAYSNVIPCLCNQLEGKYTEGHVQYNLASHEWANEMGAYMRELAVSGVPVTVHNPLETENATYPSYYTLLQDWPFPWAQLMLRQCQVSALSTAREISDAVPEQKTVSYNARGYARQNQILIDLRRFGIPVVNEEPGYEMGRRQWQCPGLFPRPWNSQTADTLVPSFWTAVTAGAYIMWGHDATYEWDDPFEGMRKSPTAGRLRVLHDFVAALPYWEMAPANEVVSPNEVTIGESPYRTNFCLAKAGDVYLVFSLEGGRLWLDLAPGGTYRITQLDPRSGATTDFGQVAGGGQAIDVVGREQVLLCRREPA